MKNIFESITNHKIPIDKLTRKKEKKQKKERSIY